MSKIEIHLQLPGNVCVLSKLFALVALQGVHLRFERLHALDNGLTHLWGSLAAGLDPPRWLGAALTWSSRSIHPTAACLLRPPKLHLIVEFTLCIKRKTGAYPINLHDNGLYQYFRTTFSTACNECTTWLATFPLLLQTSQ